ncbi:ATP-binding cassette domain-containing protein, partial [Candidatus Binatia bacterium]|nr:ATP-binding cassette domain-containing protein [Candidatus Binatia bacterium]
MIRIDGVSKRHGRQILFLEASAAIGRGEKVGLVGPNGAGKSTLFRLITREEEPDDGQVVIDRGITVGHFHQDVGEMKGRTVVEATLDGAGPVAEAAHALHELEQALADPGRATELDALVARYGEAQARFE